MTLRKPPRDRKQRTFICERKTQLRYWGQRIIIFHFSEGKCTPKNHLHWLSAVQQSRENTCTPLPKSQWCSHHTDLEKWGFSSGWAMSHHSEIFRRGKGTCDTKFFVKDTVGAAQQSSPEEGDYRNNSAGTCKSYYYRWIFIIKTTLLFKNCNMLYI